MTPTQSKRCSLRVIAATLLVGMVTASPGVGVALGAADRPTDRPGRSKARVLVSATPERIELAPGPCGKETMTVGIENPSTEPLFADVYLSEDSPLELSQYVITTYVPAEAEVAVPVEVSALAGSRPAEHQIVLRSGRERAGVTAIVSERSDGPGGNVALGQQVTASSTNGAFSPCGAVDGISDSEQWEATGWNDGTRAQFPDTLEVRFAAPEQVGRVDLYTLDSSQYPATRYGLADWDVEVLAGGEWRTVDEVRGNVAGLVSSVFEPVTAQAVRIVTLGSNDGDVYSRVVEVEAFAQ
jgi:F5/8 type C domain